MKERGIAIVIAKPEPPADSWWLSCSTREAFNEALKREETRMRTAKSTMTETKIVGTVNGRI